MNRGGSLLLQGGEPLLRVRAGEALELEREAGVEGRRLRAVPVVERMLRETDRLLRPARELGRDLERTILHLGIVDAERHEPDAFGLLA